MSKTSYVQFMVRIRDLSSLAFIFPQPRITTDNNRMLPRIKRREV